MMKEYNQHIIDRIKIGIPPKPLNAKQITHLITLLQDPIIKNKQFLLNLLLNQVPPGVDEAAYIKVKFLESIATEKIICPEISKIQSIEFLGTMQGGYNVPVLIHALNDPELAPIATNALKNTLLIFNNFEKIQKKAESGNKSALTILHSWARSEWFHSLPKLEKKITVTVFKVPGETNTDDLSPAVDAWSRPDIPLHALSMLKHPREGIIPDQPGIIGPVTQIKKLKKKGFPIAYVGDVIGTGSSRKSAVNSILWFIGQDIPYVPNKRTKGLILGGKIAPIFFNTVEDAGGFPIELNVSLLKTGDIIDIYPFSGNVYNHHDETLITKFKLNSSMLIDSVRSGGRILLIIGKQLSLRASNALQIKNTPMFDYSTYYHKPIHDQQQGFTLAQKIVGHACNTKGIHPGQYCEPKITTVGSQDTTGPMTRDELKNLACLNFSADLVMQSFCHTAAYPKSIDITLHNTLPNFIIDRGGIVLKPGDGIIHSWLNRMLLPDTVGTGGDSHTRFPIGISFPAGSGLVAFSAATGIMPLNMPESVLVKFTGNIRPGITVRDLVNAIPYFAIQKGLLNLSKISKKNIFSGKILEITGLPYLTVEQAFELSDSSAERSAAGCTIQLNQQTIINYLTANIKLLTWMITTGYQNQNTLKRRIRNMTYWLNNPSLFIADQKAKYIEIIEIDLSTIKEPIICIPNDPDDVHQLSDINSNEHKINDVFIGSCMTNIGHFRVVGSILDIYARKNNPLPSRLWIAPPTKMDALQLIKEGYYDIFSKYKARIEMPGCSLCMGNQARITDKMVVFSTSTRNFPNRLGDNTKVYLGSAEVAILSAIFGRIPTVKEYFYAMTQLYEKKSMQTIYRCLNFDQLN